jgi:hypothetical protein
MVDSAAIHSFIAAATQLFANWTTIIEDFASILCAHLVRAAAAVDVRTGAAGADDLALADVAAAVAGDALLGHD